MWEGVHITLGNRVACKFIEPDFVESEDALRRFENEARAAASLKSKHVVDVYDHGVMPDGRPYIVMEFLEGEPLDERIARAGILNIQEVALIALQTSRALARAHEHGIVHRDLKPENVFLVWDDEDQADLVKVVDFGIAKFTEAGKAGITSSTKTGSILGTPYYMSPEQARGLKSVDARSDIWSLGVICYQALTSRRPFDGEAVGDLLVRICTTDATPPSELNPSLSKSVDDWMSKALARDPNDRFQNVREMAEALLTAAELPGRETLGSAVGKDTQGSRGQQMPGVDTGPSHPAPAPSPGAGGHLAQAISARTETPATMETAVAAQPARASGLLWGGVALLLMAVAVAAFALSRQQSAHELAESEPEPISEEAEVSSGARPELPDEKDEQAATAASRQPGSQPTEPAGSTPSGTIAPPAVAPSAPTVTKVVAPAPRPTLRVTKKPAPRPTPAASSPAPVKPAPAMPAPAPTPVPTPARAPSPAPAPRSASPSIDLGY